MISQENRESKARSAHPPPVEDQPPIVIVGNGPIGIRVLRELLRLGARGGTSGPMAVAVAGESVPHNREFVAERQHPTPPRLAS